MAITPSGSGLPRAEGRGHRPRRPAPGRMGAPAGKPSTETPMHLAIYRARPEVGAIVHTHSMSAVHGGGRSPRGAAHPGRLRPDRGAEPALRRLRPARHALRWPAGRARGPAGEDGRPPGQPRGGRGSGGHEGGPPLRAHGREGLPRLHRGASSSAARPRSRPLRPGPCTRSSSRKYSEGRSPAR